MKILRPEAMGDDIQTGGYKRFEREIKSLKKVKSHNTVQYIDDGIWESNEIKHYYIVMEYLNGQDFAKYIKLNRTQLLSDEDLLKKIMGQILDGLYSLHTNNIIHRDLKPENIFIDIDLNLKLLDFGLVKMLDYSSITTKGKIVGTPLFMSPEIIEGKQIDYRSDLYSFGVMTYYILTNKYPFTGENVFVLLNNIIKTSPRRPSEILPDITNSFENIILKLLEKQPYLRPFKDALELKKVIKEISLFKVEIQSNNKIDKSYINSKFFVRLLHTERSELNKFLQNNGSTDGIEYPANFLPLYKNQINDLNSNNILYFFDPSTNRLPYSSFSKTKGLVELPYVYDKYNKLTPSKLKNIEQIKKYVKDVIEWQQTWGVHFIVAPFHFSKSLSDEWINVDLKLIEEAIEYVGEQKIVKDVYAGININIEDLTDEESRIELVNRWSKVLPDGFIFYVDAINEKTSNISQLFAYIDLLLKFKKLKRPLIAARVGALGLGLISLGIDAFTQGIASLASFSEKNILQSEATGYDMEKKYYIKDIFLCLKSQLANEILKEYSELICNCQYCKGLYDIASLSVNAKTHFLEVRYQEVKSINNREYNFIQKLKSALNILKNIKRKHRIPSFSNINAWLEVFPEFLKD